MKRLLLFLMFSSVICLAHAQSVTHYVKLGATGDGSGLSWANASTDLQSTISNANSGDSVFVAGGLYLAPLNGSFSMKNGVKIYGSFRGTEASLSERTMSAGDTSILKGNGSSVIQNNSNGLDTSAVLDGFKITGGSSNLGGGIYNNYSSPIFANLMISGNTANGEFGGGMNNYMSSPILTNVIISGNNAGFGGGMIINASSPILKNVLICGNTATYGGGGMEILESPLTFTNVTISGNSAAYGGGIYHVGTSLVLNNSIIWGNKGNNDGNEMYIGIPLSSPSSITLNYSLLRNRIGQNDIFNEAGT
ncbi:MAG TPA: hypothetical protein VL053_02100, partial [Arachidicoccus sp.]|nr:hypothetical protein [Arachidicoccus sp.]